MAIPNQFKSISVIMLALSMIAFSCKEVIEEPELSGIRLSAYISNLDYNDFPMMGKNAEIGIFVTEEGTDKVINDYSNLKFDAQFKTGVIQISSDFPIYYPQNGSMVDIVGYYPYNNELTAVNPYYSVDLSDQNAVSPGTLLLAKTSGSNSVLNKALLSLKLAYAKLNISVKLSEDTPNAADMPITLRLNEVASRAKLNVLSGEYKSFENKESVLLPVSQTSANSHVATVIPQTLTEGAEIIVEYVASDKVQSQSVKIIEHIGAFEMNKQYDIDILVSAQGVKAELVNVTDLYISDWNEDSEIITDKI